ncbi:hypothetical protein [Treponema sp. UBA753]|uniref:hypothetical protein n=1 Tax=Treponema sp. UBA753 TaxID=1947747 RepID=UPI0025EEF9EC|nr:hypothetical protein [Treponema sp. UBA753]
MAIIFEVIFVIIFCAMFLAMMVTYEPFDLFIFIALLCFIILSIIFAAKYKPLESSSCKYEITVNEKSFKASGFKTKTDGSIEFTADDGTIIRASEYEIRKLSGSNDISEGENK